MKTGAIAKRGVGSLLAASVLLGLAAAAPARQPEVRRLPVKVYRDKMKAGWIGQIAGVSVGGPTEFRCRDKIMPEEKVPKWTPEMINHAFNQDDLYVEMTFLRSMEQYGLDVPIRQAGIDFANSGYPLWCANRAGRNNLRNGIAPPDSSHPKFNRCPNDIDYQIEADYSGLIAPGMPNVAIKLGEKFGRLMNYGDGMYAGQFMGGMYAEAFFEDDPVKIARAGLRCIPAGSQYAEMVRDMLRWHQEDPDDWQKCWHKCQKKYREDPAYQKASNGGIDCKINGAYVLMGLLFGNRDLDKTIIISTRCGMDSDCNPSSSGGVLFTTVGFSKLPPRFSEKLDEKAVFSHTAYNFPALVNVCEKLARQALAASGGRVEKDAGGEEVFVIPVVEPRPSKLELSWAPGPIAHSRFTPEEMAKITAPGSTEALRKGLEKFAPGWKVANCGPDMEPGLRSELGGKKNVFVTHPLDRRTPCTLTKEVEIPAGKKTALRLVVGHFPKGDWTLIVKADGKELSKQSIGKDTAPGGWTEVMVDLSPYAGRKIKLQLLNQPSGWSWEAGYWAKISIESR
jgi:hypothetical protein